MKKLWAFLTMLCVSVPVWASPLRSGLYIGFRGGGSLADFDIPWSTSSHGNADKKDIAFTGGMVGGLRIRHFRVEVEYLTMTSQSSGDYEQELDTFMAQTYFDLPLKSVLRPFINLGFGYYKAAFKRKKEWSDSAKSFTWGGGGGLTLAISTANNLDLGYRYLDIGRFKTRDGSVEQDNHVFYFGWRHVF